jgi:hypothetical protein
MKSDGFSRSKPVTSPKKHRKELEEVWSALRDASDDMMRISGRDGPGAAGAFPKSWG